MATFQPPPTYAAVVLYDDEAPNEEALLKSAKFNPIWLKWFVDIAKALPGGGAGTGTVTAVALSFSTGIITVSGSPVTTSGTLALTVAGTSGGIPYFNASNTWASSGLLTNHAIVLGGGSAAAPVTPVGLGTTVQVLHGNAAGDPSFGAVVLTTDVSGVLPAANGGAAAWAAYTPTRTGWTDVGSPTVTARFMSELNKVFFQIKVVPATTTATVAGTSYVSLPVTATGLCGDASMGDLTTLINVGNCVIDVTNSRAYVPSQAATGDSLLIAGWYEK